MLPSGQFCTEQRTIVVFSYILSTSCRCNRQPQPRIKIKYLRPSYGDSLGQVIRRQEDFYTSFVEESTPLLLAYSRRGTFWLLSYFFASLYMLSEVIRYMLTKCLKKSCQNVRLPDRLVIEKHYNLLHSSLCSFNHSRSFDIVWHHTVNKLRV